MMKPEHESILRDWLAKTGMPVCQHCRGNSWATNGVVALPVQDIPNRPVISDSTLTVPLVVLACNNCAQTIFLSAKKIGLPVSG